ncbi:MAG: hypothetical protein ACUVTL_03630 [Thermoproteota archaeon]
MSRDMLLDSVWVWEGPYIDPILGPSIYGLGEAANYFHAHNVIYLYGPNDDIALSKLSSFKKVVCDISKWKFRGGRSLSDLCGCYHDTSPNVSRDEAMNLSKLSLKYNNIDGGIIDDFSSTYVSQEKMDAEQLAEVSRSLKMFNPRLKLYCVVYSTDLELDLKLYVPHIDVVTLWIWNNTRDLIALEEYVGKCKKVFPSKPVLVGLYLRDYPTSQAMPMELIEFEFRRTAELLDFGEIDGFIILGGFHIDKHPEQARWVREFIEKRYIEG